ncbi:hypothetical protein GPECTOR_2222g1172 [Gonium pectorale]|uniref:Uncharacterized protein n=1 Tax=Gonium pectorale TaxID=33097 RepID=A0A150FUV0_GONPE|nr:hypothetical protein GPECTOR_2222g1172 [Gonium pectorale]|eukprot:KXZ40810.1 hypothetical protein GPECTOR_2222g1172 [Gonium pectorale]
MLLHSSQASNATVCGGGVPSLRQKGTTALGDASRVWIPDLVERIARHLPPNELPCTLRLVDKATAALFSGPHHTTVRLSQPVPHHAFAQAWGQPGATQPLTLPQRQQLLCLTAATGVTPNLELAMRVAGCLIPPDLPEAAAAGGQLATCLWLLQQRCEPPSCDLHGDWAALMAAAAGSGRRDVCDGLLVAAAEAAHSSCDGGDGGGCGDGGAAAAPSRRGTLLAAAGVLPAPATQPLPTQAAAVPAGLSEALMAAEAVEHAAGYAATSAAWRRCARLGPLAAAAGSRTPDWAAKVEWLEAQGWPKTAAACNIAAAASCADAVSRLAWLRQRGYPIDVTALTTAAAATGNVAAVRFALEAASCGLEDMHLA